MWHTVGILRIGHQLFIFHPGLNMDEVDNGVTRLQEIKSIIRVYEATRKGNNLSSCSKILIQGCPPGASANNMECMGRTAEWMEKVLTGILPYPPNSTAAGGPWKRIKQN
jgi:hypothetical protein